RDPLLPRLRQHRVDARVRVLYVVDGILGRLPPGQLEVEVDRRVVRAREHEPAGRVDPDLADQLVEGDEVAAPLGHRRARAALYHVDEPHEWDLQARRG